MPASLIFVFLLSGNIYIFKYRLITLLIPSLADPFVTLSPPPPPHTHLCFTPLYTFLPCSLLYSSSSGLWIVFSAGDSALSLSGESDGILNHVVAALVLNGCSAMFLCALVCRTPCNKKIKINNKKYMLCLTSYTPHITGTFGVVLLHMHDEFAGFCL